MGRIEPSVKDADFLAVFLAVFLAGAFAVRFIMEWISLLSKKMSLGESCKKWRYSNHAKLCAPAAVNRILTPTGEIAYAGISKRVLSTG